MMDEQKAFCDSLDDATTQLVQLAARNAETCGLYLEGQTKKETPVDMGLLRAANGHQVDVDNGQITLTLYNVMEYAPYVHQGTGVYAEDGDGRKTPWVYTDAKGNTHKTAGQKPNPFMRRAIEKNKGKISKLLGEGSTSGT